jgi:hypothetical protein
MYANVGDREAGVEQQISALTGDVWSCSEMGMHDPLSIVLKRIGHANMLRAMRCSELPQHFLESGIGGVIRLDGHRVHLPVGTLGSDPLVMPRRGAAPDRIAVTLAPIIETICYVLTGPEEPRLSATWFD